MNEYDPESISAWLCKGGPCDESGDRCKVLSEDCCACVYAGNLIVRQSAELKADWTAYTISKDTMQAELDRLSAENRLLKSFVDCLRIDLKNLDSVSTRQTTDIPGDITGFGVDTRQDEDTEDFTDWKGRR